MYFALLLFETEFGWTPAAILFSKQSPGGDRGGFDRQLVNDNHQVSPLTDMSVHTTPEHPDTCHFQELSVPETDLFNVSSRNISI